MIARPRDVRRLLSRYGFQVSETAIVQLSALVQQYAADLAERTVRAILERNERRAIQHLEPLRRITDDHVIEALRGGRNA